MPAVYIGVEKLCGRCSDFHFAQGEIVETVLGLESGSGLGLGLGFLEAEAFQDGRVIKKERL